MHDDVIGYTYKNENLCPDCTITKMVEHDIEVPDRLHPAVPDKLRPQDAVVAAAGWLGIDLEDERSYDSGDFPKPITEIMAETEITGRPDHDASISDERCAGCGMWLLEGEPSPTPKAMRRHLRERYQLPVDLARRVQHELLGWGYSHPDHIDADDVRLAATRVRHDYVTVSQRSNGDVTTWTTPQYADDWCTYCRELFETHRIRRRTRRRVVGAAETHRHPTVPDGQRDR